MRQLAGHVSAGPTPPAVLIQVSPDFGTYPWLGLVKGPLRRVWVSPAQPDQFEALLPAAGRLSLVVDRPHIASNYPGDALAGWLNQHAYRLGSAWIEGFEVIDYAAGAPAGPMEPAAITWPNGIALTAFTLPRSVLPGTALTMDLVFARVGAEWSAYDRFFANLVSPAGEVIAGHESELQFGQLAVTGWSDGQPALDRRGVWLPPDAPPGLYRLIVGFANASGYVPAQLPGGQTADYVELAVVDLGSAPGADQLVK
jgi:hypothetical protein